MEEYTRMSRPNMLKWRDELRLPAERLFTQNCATNILKGPASLKFNIINLAITRFIIFSAKC